MSRAPRGESTLPVLNNKVETPSRPGEYRIHKVEITQRGIGQSSSNFIIKELQSYSRHPVANSFSSTCANRPAKHLLFAKAPISFGAFAGELEPIVVGTREHL